MKRIEFQDCRSCPFSTDSQCGQQVVCNHTSIQVKFPYAKDRKASPTFTKKYCPIPEVEP